MLAGSQLLLLAGELLLQAGELLLQAGCLCYKGGHLFLLASQLLLQVLRLSLLPLYTATPQTVSGRHCEHWRCAKEYQLHSSRQFLIQQCNSMQFTATRPGFKLYQWLSDYANKLRAHASMERNRGQQCVTCCMPILQEFSIA